MNWNEFPLRTRIFIIGGVVLVVVIGMFLAIVLGSGDASDVTVRTTAEQDATSSVVVPGSLPPEAVETLKREVASNPTLLVHSFAKSFAERFGSFSNAANFENMTELKPFMTSRMQAWTDKTVAAERAKQTAAPETEYYGMVTRALAITKDTLDTKTGRGSLTIATQRRERRGTTETSFAQDIYMELERVNDEWRVDGVEWITSNNQ